VIAFIVIPVFIGSLDLTIVSAFLPELIVELQLPLQTSLDDTSWILSGYLLAYTVSLTFSGRLSDLIGRRAVDIACLLIFIVGSLWVAVAQGLPSQWVYRLLRMAGERPDPAVVDLISIIIGRVIQALGAGTGARQHGTGERYVPARTTRSTAGVDWRVRHARLGVGAFIRRLVVTGARALLLRADDWATGCPVSRCAPLGDVAWQALFWVNIPLSLIALGMVVWGLRHVPQIRREGRFDWLGTTLLVGALIVLNVSLGANIEVGGASSFDEMSSLPLTRYRAWGWRLPCLWRLCWLSSG
jgi:MFS family permease